jgi:hypothetical protein
MGSQFLPSPKLNELAGVACYCKSGCIETFLSGLALTGQFRAAAAEDSAPRKLRVPPNKAIVKR